MKNSIRLVVICAQIFLLAAMPAGAQQSGIIKKTTLENCSVQILLDKETYALGDPVWVSIVVKNAGEEHIFIAHEISGTSVVPLLTGLEGQPIFLSSDHRPRLGGIVSSWVRISIAPSRELRYKVLLNRLYDLSKSGKYQLRSRFLVSAPVQRTHPTGKSQSLGEAVSEPAVFRIVDENWFSYEVVPSVVDQAPAADSAGQ